jgi:DNA-binding transcriptional ArsR family regulator
MNKLCNEMERLGKGLGNSSRYKILESLLRGHKTVGELVKVIKLSQPAVSQHLKTLKSSNLVTDQRHGQEVFYSVNSEYMLGLLKNLSAQIGTYVKNNS